MALFFVENQEWLTAFQLPSYAPELNPQEGVWSMIKRGLVDFAAANLDHLAPRHEAQAQEDPVPSRADRRLSHRDRTDHGCRMIDRPATTSSTSLGRRADRRVNVVDGGHESPGSRGSISRQIPKGVCVPRSSTT